MFDLKSLFTKEELKKINEDYIFWWAVNNWGLREKFLILMKEMGVYDD